MSETSALCPVVNPPVTGPVGKHLQKQYELRAAQGMGINRATEACLQVARMHASQKISLANCHAQDMLLRITG